MATVHRNGTEDAKSTNVFLDKAVSCASWIFFVKSR